MSPLSAQGASCQTTHWMSFLVPLKKGMKMILWFKSLKPVSIMNMFTCWYLNLWSQDRAYNAFHFFFLNLRAGCETWHWFQQMAVVHSVPVEGSLQSGLNSPGSINHGNEGIVWAVCNAPPPPPPKFTVLPATMKVSMSIDMMRLNACLWAGFLVLKVPCNSYFTLILQHSGRSFVPISSSFIVSLLHPKCHSLSLMPASTLPV